MSSLLELAIARTSNFQRPVAQFTIDSFTMIVFFNDEDKGYYIVNPADTNSYTRIPDTFTIGNTITWFYNTYCAPMLNQEPNYNTPSFTLHKRVGRRLYPLRKLSNSTCIRLLKAKWHELSPNTVIGNLSF